MVFNATFNNISVISCRSFYWWRKPEYLSNMYYLYIVNDAVTLEKEESEEAEGTISRPASPVAKEETPAEGEPPGLVAREGN